MIGFRRRALSHPRQCTCAHHVVAEFALDLRGAGEFFVGDAAMDDGPQLGHLLGADEGRVPVLRDLVLGLGHREPDPAPGLELLAGRPDAEHLFGRVARRERGRIGVVGVGHERV